MNASKWRLGLVIVLVILIGTLFMQWADPSMLENHPLANLIRPDYCPSDSVAAYFPTWSGTTYEFAGEGLEFAQFTRRITYATSELIQVEDLSGTNQVKIMEVTPQELRIVWTAEEFYEERNLLEPWVKGERSTLPGREEVLVPLKAPLQEGESWSDGRFKREIYQVNSVVTVPLGTFHDVIVVKSKALDADDGVQYDYYAKNLGLIKRESRYESFTVTSTLEGLEVVNTHVYRRN